VKLPRDISGTHLAHLLQKYEYQIDHQTGSHIRLVSNFQLTRHRITIPAHDPLKIGTLNGILNEIAVYLKMEKESLVRKLFGK
jgi:predicted RNA binding protein YcfA (HicA-like mRNA interferase family)